MNKILWALQIIVGLYFIGVSGANFIGIAPMVAQFNKIGVGQWFRYVTAICQLLGGVALLIPGYAGYGALLLVCVMLGAIIVRLTVLDGSPLVAIVLLVITAFIAWVRLRNA